MNAEAYDLLVSFLGSAIGGLVFFLLGVGAGFLRWHGMKARAKRAEARLREEERPARTGRGNAADASPNLET